MTSIQMEPTAKWGPRENWRIIKNVFVLGLAFMVQYTAFHGAFNLQSSINAEGGLGTASMSIQYVAVLISSFFLPVLVINFLGTKWAIPACFTMFMPYIAAQLHPAWATLIPATVAAGLASAPLWCSMCTYIATVSEAHSMISKISKDIYIARYLGNFFVVFHINQIWGNIISSVVLSSGGNKAAVTSMNASLIPELCGANFLASDDAGKALQHQPPEKIQMLVCIYLACMLGAMMIVAFGLDSPKRYKSGSLKESGVSDFSLLTMTLQILVRPNQLLLSCLAVFIGLQQAFVAADLTVAFVSCAIGPGTVGYVMMSHGIADACSCAVTGVLVRLIGRVRLICLAIVVNITLYLMLLLWRPQPDVVYMHYVIAIVAGIANSIFLVQINAYYGIIFPGEEAPAFANFRLFESIGFIVSYGISPYFRTSTKVYMLFTMMTIGCIGYFIVEYRLRKSKRCSEVTKESNGLGCDNKSFQGFKA